MTIIASLYIPSWWDPTHRDLLTLPTNCKIQSDNGDSDFPDHKKFDPTEDEVSVEDITFDSHTHRYNDVENTVISQTRSSQFYGKQGRSHQNRNVILKMFPVDTKTL